MFKRSGGASLDLPKESIELTFLQSVGLTNLGNKTVAQLEAESKAKQEKIDQQIATAEKVSKL